MGIERYLLQRTVATDGAATVHEAIDSETGRPVAVNRWPVDPGLSADARERMSATALQAQGLQHPGIVELHDVGWDGEGAYAVAEFVEGETLAQFLARTRRLPALQGLSLSLQLLSALAAAHERGLVHSALNPQHVLMARNGQLKIAGFGWLAAAASAGRRPGVFDVPAYMAPEQVLGRPADCRSDLYSAAVLAYELLTGSWPYQAHTAPGPARELRHELPAGLDAVFERALARSPEARHRNAGELAAALQAAFGMPVQEPAVAPVRPQRVVQAPAHPAPVPRSGPARTAPAAARRRRAGVALVAGLAAAVLLGVMFFGVGEERTPAPLAGLDPRTARDPVATPAADEVTAQAASPAPGNSPSSATPAPPAPEQPAPAVTAREGPKPNEPRANARPAREAAPGPATARPAETPPRMAVERRAEPGVRETTVAEPIEAPPREVAAAPSPPPPPAPRPSETVEPAPQPTAAAEPPPQPEPASRATAVMAAPPSPSPLNVCRQESAMARELCVAAECASTKYPYHPVCLRMYEDAVERHKLDKQDGP